MLDSESLSGVDEDGGMDKYEEYMRKTLFSKANMNIKNAQDRQKRDYDKNTTAERSVHFLIFNVTRLEVYVKLVAGCYVPSITHMFTVEL